MLLNIAEGNGRFARLDKANFWDKANRAAIRVAALLDVCSARQGEVLEGVEEAKAKLERVELMTRAMVTKSGGTE